MTLRLLALAPLLLAAAPTPAEGPAARWGEHGHVLVGRAAAEALPAEMPAFFRAAAEQLAYLNPEPDRWRDRAERDLDEALNAARAPEHYVDLELVPEGGLEAPDRFAYADSLALSGGTAKTAGVLPYQILELAQRLRVGFRQWRAAESEPERAFVEARILNDAGILGHYVADGSNPHHTTIHYNGWVGEDGRFEGLEDGFHYRFESAYVEANVGLEEVRAAVRPARDLGPLRPAVWGYVADTHALVERLYELDEQESFGPATAGAAHRAFAVDRLAAGASMLRDLWWTAWATSAPAE